MAGVRHGFADAAKARRSIEMVVCVPVAMEGMSDPGWGRADRVAIAEVTGDGIAAWQEFDVGWSTLHDAGTEGSHHARVARFLQANHTEAAIADSRAMS